MAGYVVVEAEKNALLRWHYRAINSSQIGAGVVALIDPVIAFSAIFGDRPALRGPEVHRSCLLPVCC